MHPLTPGRRPRFFRSRGDTALDVLAVREQLAVLKRKRPRPTLNFLDRLFWTPLRGLWPRWADVLVIVKPETVIGWHHRVGLRPLLTLVAALLREIARRRSAS